jgi:anti-sigma factor RsiW
MSMEQTAELATQAPALIESDNPSPEELAAFIDGRLSNEDRARLEAYFSSNASARKELIDASRIVATLPTSERRNTRWIPFAGIAAAAAIVVLLVRPADHARLPGVAASGQRGVGAQSQTIALVSPSVGESVANAGLRGFVWRSLDGATYRLIVSDASGKTLLQQNTADTIVAMPLAIADNTPGTYYWSVDALESDGSSVTSGVRAFTLGKK